MSYNLDGFKLNYYDETIFEGPRAGESAVDFTVRDSDGVQVSLSDFRGKWVVLEMGALSCPMYARGVERVRDLKKDFPDMEFLLLYVREPHPGGRLAPHKTYSQKVSAAQKLEHSFGEHRRILVDDVDGRIHIQYGTKPNSVYVINPAGIVTYRSDWVIMDKLRRVLENREEVNHEDHAWLNEFDFPSLGTTFKALRNGGWRAVWEMIREIPFFNKAHREADDHYQKNGMKQGSVGH